MVKRRLKPNGLNSKSNLNSYKKKLDLSPTETDKKDDKTVYQKVQQSQVPSEESSFDKIANIFGSFNSILSVFIIVIGFTMWLTYMSFNISEAQGNISKNEKALELVKKENIEISKDYLSTNKDVLQNIKKIDDLENNIVEVNDDIDNINEKYISLEKDFEYLDKDTQKLLFNSIAQ